ncbi:MAG: DUF488 domain-containing protein [Sphingomonadales bacterium]
MNISAKRVYESPQARDGTRILVDRVWPRGLTKEAAAIDVWLKEVAPTTWLRRWFHHDPMRWQEFVRRYRSELDSNGSAVGRLLELCKAGPATLVYAARDMKHNHALVLVEYMIALTKASSGN